MMNCRPKKRSQCVNGVRPCPWVGCRHHMIWAVNKIDRLSNDQIIEKISQMPETCTLDVADQGGLTFDDMAHVLGLTRSRVAQLVSGDKRNIGAVNRLRHCSRRHILESFAV